uniref:SH3 domain-containing protein n=1 Tax=Catharus ustulatus TaxID=91951 RepID=A0A8C3VCC9_CATUS
MAYRELVRRWHEAVRAADRGHWDAALDAFGGIAEPPARICFNVGCVQLLAGRPEAALRAFNKTIEKDNSLAVGYFQRGFAQFLVSPLCCRYEEALSDYHMAFSHLRQNPFIDYKQLGLRHVLHAWEVRLSLAQQSFLTVGGVSSRHLTPDFFKEVHSDCKNILFDHLFLEPMLVPLRELFRPRKKEVEQLDSKDFLGKPKVTGKKSCLYHLQRPMLCRDPEQDGQSLHSGCSDSLLSPQIPPGCGEAPAGAARPAVLRLRCECSLVLRAGEAPALPALRALLRDRLAEQAQRGTLRYGALGCDGAAAISLRTCTPNCLWDSDSHSGRPVLYQMLAQHSYLAQGPGDLEFSKGDVLDILSEVNKDWLEGRCNGKTGIFPKCFATQTSYAALSRGFWNQFAVGLMG